MKRTTGMNRAAWVVLSIPLVACLTVFQNCSKVAFTSASTAPENGVLSTPDKPSQFVEMAVGQAPVPPLKLIFVVDNSYTMQANQISLSSAFGSLFSGSNASNLSAFDTTAYIFTTSQDSLAPSDPSFSLLPTLTPDTMNTMSPSALTTLRGGVSAQVNGLFSGDLVSYAVDKSVDPATMYNIWSYVPAPVLGIEQSGTQAIDLGIHKSQSGSVGDFASSFSNRISYISPTRSAMTAQGHGILDPVIDHESGLCALARVLKNNSNFLQKGDMAAYVIVSDEDDNDPSGQNCVDKYVNYDQADLIDTHCTTPQTTISFNAANTTAPTCTQSYESKFSYQGTFNVANVAVTYNDLNYKLINPKTTVAYKQLGYTYQNYKFPITYTTYNPSYQLPQTTVSWTIKSQQCLSRDQVTYGCQDVLTPASKTVQGAYANGTTACTSQAPSGALNVTCAAAAPTAVIYGACSSTDSTKLFCQQNPSTGSATAYNDSATASCATLQAGVVPSGAQNVVCGQAVPQPTGGTGIGACDSSHANCAQTYTSKSTTVAAHYDGTNCSAIVAGQLPTNSVYADANSANVPKCTLADYPDQTATNGTCPTTLPSGKIGCTQQTPVADKGFVVNGSLGSQSCPQFVAATKLLPTYADSSSIACTPGSTPSSVSATIAYTATNYPGLNPKVGDACPPSLTTSLQQQNSAPDLACKITDIGQQPKVYNGTCAANATAIAALCANPANHACDATGIDNQSSANQPYQTAKSTKIVTGNITCATSCASAGNACGGVTTGTLADVYHNCQAAPASDLLTNYQTGILASMKAAQCSAPATVVVDKSYSTTGTAPQYVAGSGSSSGDQMALINYIKSRSQELLGAELPATSVFVTQSNPGQAESIGKTYQSFATQMGGTSHNVQAAASEYATSLQSLGAVIKEKIGRAFAIQGFQQGQTVLHAWYQQAGSSVWVEKQEGTDWTQSGGTVTVNQSLDIKAGDNFRFEYK